MVQVNELPEGADDHNYIDVTDDESDEEISSSEETLLERLAALKYMVPFKIRNRLFMFYHKWTGRLVYGFNKLGNGMWIMTTTIFLVGFPLFYEYQKEQHMIMLEKEQRLFPGSPDTMPQNGGGNPLTPNIFPIPSPK